MRVVRGKVIADPLTRLLSHVIENSKMADLREYAEHARG